MEMGRARTSDPTGIFNGFGYLGFRRDRMGNILPWQRALRGVGHWPHIHSAFGERESFATAKICYSRNVSLVSSKWLE